MAAHVNSEKTMPITSMEYNGLQEKNCDINEICESIKDQIDLGDNVTPSNLNGLVQEQTSRHKAVVPNGCVKPLLKIEEITKNSLNIFAENGCSSINTQDGVTLDSTNSIDSTQSHTITHQHDRDKPNEGEDTEEGKDSCSCITSSDLTVDRTENVDPTENMPKVEPVSVGALKYVVYESELQMPDIMRLITKDLSEPYSIYTYRYFIHNWPKLCFLAMDEDVCVGAIVCKLDVHKNMVRRGYIAMLAVDDRYRRRKIGSHLVMKAIKVMVADNCDEVVLETEITNKPALRLYENLGFVRDKRLFRYYLNGVDALRLKLWLR